MKLVLLATNRESYGHISALITRARMRAAAAATEETPAEAATEAATDADRVKSSAHYDDCDCTHR